jgi:hypothetical protein
VTGIAKACGGGCIARSCNDRRTPDAGRRTPDAGRRTPDAGRRTHQLDPSVTGQRERAGSRGGEATGKDPTNRGKLGTKRHIVVDPNGVPLALTMSGANATCMIPSGWR